MKLTPKLSLILLLLLALETASREIEIPALKDSSPASVKLGLSKVIKQPDFDFKRVYKREVNKIYSDDTYRFPPCTEQKPEVQFDVLDEIIFEGIPKPPVVMEEFKDM